MKFNERQTPMVRHTLLLMIKSALKCYCINLHAFATNESALPSNDGYYLINS